MSQWIRVCPLEVILPGTGVCALVGEEQVAIFRPYDDEQVFAISNIDPFAEASVLSRGLIAEHQGDLWVASPLKNNIFVCMTVNVWKMKLALFVTLTHVCAMAWFRSKAKSSRIRQPGIVPPGWKIANKIIFIFRIKYVHRYS